MRRTLSVWIVGAVLFGGACGNVQNTGGTGGSPGATGGTPGATGGTPGTGGGAAGAPGTGGQGGQGDGGQTCDEIKAAFAQALAAAMSCTPDAQHQCEALALIEPLGMCPGCSQYVNDATTIDALRAQWDQQQCSQPTLCPAIACAIPRPATCVAGDGSSGATCQPSLTPTN